MTQQTITNLFRNTYSAWNRHEAPRLGAALAFYTLFSLAPLMILVIAIVAMIFERSAVQNQILYQVDTMIGPQGSEAVKGLIEHTQKPASSLMAAFAGVVALLFGASGVFGELRAALNKIWDVVPQRDAGLWQTIQQQFFSFGMVLAVGFLLMVSLVVSAALAVVGKFFGDLLPLPEFILSSINFAVSLAGTTILFALIFRYVPEAKIAWRDVWVGAIITSLLFTIGKIGLGLYLGKTAVGSAYGAAGSLVVVIVWVYYSAMIFLFGAEFTRVFSTPKRVVPHTTRRHLAEGTSVLPQDYLPK